MSTHHHVLRGCQPTPLSNYLKALGVLKLVSEQGDPSATGAWSADGFVLNTQLDLAAIEAFFLNAFEPSPITNPWNGDGGYRMGKRSGAADQIEAIEESSSLRFRSYRQTIRAARAALGAHPGQDLKAFKDQLIQRLRSTAPDAFLHWMDAVMVLADDRFISNPLFGSGGNDGSQDFSKAYLTALASVIDLSTGAPTPEGAPFLRSSIFDDPLPGLLRESPGQYNPQGAGGNNAQAGLDAPERSNPWDTLLNFEGGLLLAASATRKLDGAARAAFPFTVRSSGSGYASSALSDESSQRAYEFWFPLWEHPATLMELRSLLREGRVTVGSDIARTGTEFALAIGQLGVDRGIGAFQRFGLLERKGLSYMAAPLGVWQVQENPAANLIDQRLMAWVNRFRSAVDSSAPGAMVRVRRQVDNALMDLARRGGPAESLGVLAALGQAEHTIARSGWTEKLRPVPVVNGAGWIDLVDHRRPEIRLAAALAGTDIRRRRTGVRVVRSNKFGLISKWPDKPDPGQVFTVDSLISGLIRVALRRQVEHAAAAPRPPARRGSTTAVSANLDDITAFIHGELDDAFLLSCIQAFMICDRVAIPLSWSRRTSPALYSLAAPVVHRHGFPSVAHDTVANRTSGVVQRLACADGQNAIVQCLRRFQSMGVRPVAQPWTPGATECKRTAASLVFPLSIDHLRTLVSTVAVPTASVESTHESSEETSHAQPS